MRGINTCPVALRVGTVEVEVRSLRHAILRDILGAVHADSMMLSMLSMRLPLPRAPPSPGHGHPRAGGMTMPTRPGPPCLVPVRGLYGLR